MKKSILMGSALLLVFFKGAFLSPRETRLQTFTASRIQQRVQRLLLAGSSNDDAGRHLRQRAGSQRAPFMWPYAIAEL